MYDSHCMLLLNDHLSVVFVYLGLAFLVYRLIPLLPELRETMDWTFSDTSLSLINWFKVQEIYSLIYLVKVQRNREKVTFCTASSSILCKPNCKHQHCGMQSYPRDLGEKQSWLVKIFVGGLLLVGLIVLIWLPLLLISVIGQASEPNPPTEVNIKLNIGGFQVYLLSTSFVHLLCLYLHSLWCN